MIVDLEDYFIFTCTFFSDQKNGDVCRCDVTNAAMKRTNRRAHPIEETVWLCRRGVSRYWGALIHAHVATMECSVLLLADDARGKPFPYSRNCVALGARSADWLQKTGCRRMDGAAPSID